MDKGDRKVTSMASACLFSTQGEGGGQVGTAQVGPLPAFQGWCEEQTVFMVGELQN